MGWWGQVDRPLRSGLALTARGCGGVQVNYVGKGANLYAAGYQLSGSAYVISKHIGNTWLWDRVRVSGGAYGGFCDFDSHSGEPRSASCCGRVCRGPLGRLAASPMYHGASPPFSSELSSCSVSAGAQAGRRPAERRCCDCVVQACSRTCRTATPTW